MPKLAGPLLATVALLALAAPAGADARAALARPDARAALAGADALAPDGSAAAVLANGAGAADARRAAVAAAQRGALQPLKGRGSCAAGRGIGGCVAARGLVNPVTAAFAGDGRNLYVGSLGNGGLFQFRRDPRSGRLSAIDGQPVCWGSQQGCRDHAGEQTMPQAIAIPGDERHLYVTSADWPGDEEAVGVIGYARDGRSGALTPLAPGVVCPRTERGRCVAPRGGIADEDVVATRDGRFVYGLAANGIVALARDSETGALRQPDGAAGCLVTTDASTQRDVDLDGCAREASLGNLRDLALSPDGRFLFAAGEPDEHRRGGGVTVLARDAESGALRVVQTVGRGWEDGVTDLALSADGRSLYAVDGEWDVHALRVGGDGRIAQVAGKAGCLGLERSCTFPTSTEAPEEVAVTPDGRNVYTADATALDAWSRDRRGGLHALRGRDACHTRNGLDGTYTKRPRCTKSPLRALGMSLSGIVASPDGRQLYVLGGWHASGRAVGIVEAVRRR